jgi:hypothetical protein
LLSTQGPATNCISWILQWRRSYHSFNISDYNISIPKLLIFIFKGLANEEQEKVYLSHGDASPFTKIFLSRTWNMSMFCYVLLSFLDGYKHYLVAVLIWWAKLSDRNIGSSILQEPCSQSVLSHRTCMVRACMVRTNAHSSCF